MRPFRPTVVVRSCKAATGAVIIGVFVVIAVVGPWLATDPSATTGSTLKPPSLRHLLGTTATGQDVFAQVVVGARVSLEVGTVAAAIATALAVAVGVSSGYRGGFVDDALSLLMNVFLVLPVLPLVIVVAGYRKGAGTSTIALILGLTSWSWPARLLRAQTLSVRSRDYVLAARAVGERPWRIVVCEIVPNESALIVAQFINTMIFAMLAQASLAFLGVGSVTAWSWGTMLYWAQNAQALSLGAWWWFVPPGLCLALLGGALALLNFGINDVGSRRSRPLRGIRQQTAARSFPPVDGDALFDDAVCDITGLTVEYGAPPGVVRATDGIDLTLRSGRMLGVAGESGSGKSTLAHAMARLIRPPAAVTAGNLRYRHPDNPEDWTDLLAIDETALRRLRWAHLAIVVQSAMNALNPVLRVQDQLIDAITAHRRGWGRAELQTRAGALLDLVDVSRDRLSSYPHELSGGMRQRVMVAMALALEPDVLIMDEPTTALDGVTQRQVVARIAEARQRLGSAVMFITHDLPLLLEVADDIAVMYAGRLVELSPASVFRTRPAHPYSQGLVRSFPALHGGREPRPGLAGAPPDLRHLAAGCSFAPRCERRMDTCATEAPPLVRVPTGAVDGAAHLVACWLYAPDGIPRVVPARTPA